MAGPGQLLLPCGRLTAASHEPCPRRHGPTLMQQCIQKPGGAAHRAAITTARCAASLVLLQPAAWPQGRPSRLRARHTSRIATSVYRPPSAVPSSVPSRLSSLVQKSGSS